MMWKDPQSVGWPLVILLLLGKEKTNDRQYLKNNLLITDDYLSNSTEYSINNPKQQIIRACLNFEPYRNANNRHSENASNYQVLHFLESNMNSVSRSIPRPPKGCPFTLAYQQLAAICKSISGRLIYHFSFIGPKSLSRRDHQYSFLQESITNHTA